MALTILGTASISTLTTRQVFAVETPDVCSDSVSVFRRSNDGKNIVIIGTAHISEDSANLVRRIVKSIRPDVVMIELDPKRIGKTGEASKSLQDMGFDTPMSTSSETILLNNGVTTNSNNRKSFFNDFLQSVSGAIFSVVQDAGGVLVGKVLSEFYKSIEKLGFVAGGEFKAAVEEGRLIGSRILLGDRTYFVHCC